jgi:pantetheine-phosphate adenylyltransferase
MATRRSRCGGVAELVAVCPGTYDPVTSGHLDIIRRAAGIFDRVIVAVVRAPQHKRTMFTLDDRIGFIQESLGGTPNVTVEGFATLVVEFARERGAQAIVKGLRAVSDFEWEFQMNNLNRGMAPEIETMYLMASPEYSFLSSRGVREIATFGGSVAQYVPEPVARRLAELHAAGEL